MLQKTNDIPRIASSNYPSSHINEILLVEDSPLHLVILKHWLKKAGHKVTFVSDGFEALSTIQHQSPFDLILINCELSPLMSGLELSKYIRELEERIGYTPIVIGYSSFLEEEDSFEAGMDYMLQKPLNEKVLQRAIDYWIEPDKTARIHHQSVSQHRHPPCIVRTKGTNEPA